MNTSTCDTMLTFSNNTELRISLIINWLIIIPTIPIVVYSLHYSVTNRLFHKNTQLQVTVHLVGLLVHCIGRFVLHSADLINFFRPYDNGCDILPNFYRCLIFRFLYNFGQALVSMTPISVTIERFVATRYNNGYENCPFGYGVFLAVLQIMLAFAYLFTRYIHAAFSPSSYTFFYCQTLTSSTISTAETFIPLFVIIGAHCISMAAFRLLEIRNHRLRAVADINLSSRYTLDQGKRSFAALKSFIYYNCIMVSTITMGIVILYVFKETVPKPQYMALIEITHALPLYGIFLCLGVWWRLRAHDGEQKRTLTMAIRGGAVHTELYFQMFEQQIKI